MPERSSLSFVIGCSDVWLSIHPKPEKVVQNELRNYVSGEPPLDATTCPSGCTSTAGACACPVQLDQQVLPGLCEVASITWISGPSVVSPFHLFDCDVAAGWHACDPCWRGCLAESSRVHGQKGGCIKNLEIFDWISSLSSLSKSVTLGASLQVIVSSFKGGITMILNDPRVSPFMSQEAARFHRS